ncbi:hypothetical protein Emin_0915 [Elusimicrobium minutum Pei191]|uniref:Outer membrane protein beta-barrel domain-containing protein n=1 Tax=Elusimicrobium minutum (strain Pei191) TaxID=445932 RepID=B2KD72_ELUMP|nr:outer membrane beta-barrel protein [Elusimicrobium minutum]ACC98468.1 hypothetical protein Emin_0915 [Elusimicrobium minutum Pei191]
MQNTFVWEQVLIMKRLVLLLFAFTLATTVTAAENQKGDIHVGILISTAYPFLGTWGGEYYVNNYTQGIRHDAKLGKWSVGSDFEVIYFLDPHWAVGLKTGHNEFFQRVASGVDERVGTDIFNIMFLTKYYFNPKGKIKYYMPVSLGVAFIEANINLDRKEEFNDIGFAAKIGLGAEYDLTERWGTGVELKYNHNTFNTRETTLSGDIVKLYPRANYFSFGVSLFYKF